VSLLREAEPGFGLGTLCGLFGYSRQTYYKRVDDEGFRQLALEPMIVDRVKEYRNDNPRLGSVKLWLMLKRQFEDTGCFPGRDAFIELLRRHGLMVKIRRRHHYVTTDSNHNYRRYPNLIKGMAVTAPNRVWVSDITYIETEEGVFYLSLVTDLYSHKIVGWSLGPTLDTTYPLEALHKADKNTHNNIHHTP
jgi:transposase InsO family protein